MINYHPIAVARAFTNTSSERILQLTFYEKSQIIPLDYGELLILFEIKLRKNQNRNFLYLNITYLRSSRQCAINATDAQQRNMWYRFSDEKLQRQSVNLKTTVRREGHV